MWQHWFCVCLYVLEWRTAHTSSCGNSRYCTMFVYASRDVCSSVNSTGSNKQQGASLSGGWMNIKLQANPRAHRPWEIRRGNRKEAATENATEMVAESKGGFRGRMKPPCSDQESLAGITASVALVRCRAELSIRDKSAESNLPAEMMAMRLAPANVPRCAPPHWKVQGLFVSLGSGVKASTLLWAQQVPNRLIRVIPSQQERHIGRF